MEVTHKNGRQPVRIYPFGVNRSRLEAQIRSLGLPAAVVGDQHQADVVLTVRNYYRRKPQALRDALLAVFQQVDDRSVSPRAQHDQHDQEVKDLD